VVSKRALPLANSRFDVFDIVVVPFPYADRLAGKRRPALVISNRRLAPFGLIWMAMITSAANDPWSCDVAIVDLVRAGLPAPSVVRTAKIACIEPARIERRAGRLDKATAKSRGTEVERILGKRVRTSDKGFTKYWFPYQTPGKSPTNIRRSDRLPTRPTPRRRR
jgi:mRNA interferase MazF